MTGRQLTLIIPDILLRDGIGYEEFASHWAKLASTRGLVLPVSGEKCATGKTDSRVTFIEFADFRCGYCKEAHPLVKKLMQEYDNRVKFVFKNLPLTPNGELLARSAHCAGVQGKFWQFHDRLFSTDDSPESVAGELGIDIPNFKACRSAESTRTSVLGDATEARSLGIAGTPTFIINGRLLTGIRTYEELANILDEELARL